MFPSLMGSAKSEAPEFGCVVIWVGMSARPVGFIVADMTSMTVSDPGVKNTETGSVVTLADAGSTTVMRTFDLIDCSPEPKTTVTMYWPT